MSRSAPGPALAGRSLQKRRECQNQPRRTAGPSRRPEKSIPHQTTKASPVPLFGRRRRAQIRIQSLSEPRSGPIRCKTHSNTPIYRSLPPTTGRPCASPSTSASAWAALSPQKQPINKTGKGHSALIPPDQFQCDNENRTPTPRQQCLPGNHARARHVPQAHVLRRQVPLTTAVIAGPLIPNLIWGITYDTNQGFNGLAAQNFEEDRHGIQSQFRHHNGGAVHLLYSRRLHSQLLPQ